MDASFVQTDFRGGEWSPFAQGRLDDKEYGRALNVCFNSFPAEEGAWIRRSGTRRISTTCKGGFAWLIPFHFSNTTPYIMEMTDSNIRFYAGQSPVLSADTQQLVSVSTANPAVATTVSAHGWTTGDVAMFLFAPTGVDNSPAGPVVGLQFAITVLTSTTFSLADPVTGVGLDGSTFTIPTGTSIGRVLDINTSPYTETQLQDVRSVQAELMANNVLQGQVVLLHGSVAPQVVVNSTPANTGAFAQFALNAITFKDGPYFDPPNTGTVTPSGLSGNITISAAPVNTFASTDVGRMIRLLSEPATWLAGTAYVTGNVVKYNDGTYYTALAGSTGKAPNTNPTLWAINTTAAVWAWGTITAFTSTTQVSVALNSVQALLYTTPISTWRLGVFSATTGYPTCGVFHEGRLWLAGAQGNRFDGSNSNDPFNFSPTAIDGTVGDANAISYVFNSDDVNAIYWMVPGHGGIVAGTQGGEWLISASQLSDPLTPTSIQAHRSSTYKCAAIPPVHTAFSTIFVQAQSRRLLEYTADVFSGKFLGRNITEKARHLTGPGIAQIAYQQDTAPILWMRMTDGSLAGATYKRESSFTSEPPAFVGWHRHALGSGYLIESIAVGPSQGGNLDTLTMSVVDPATGVRHIEMMADMFDETNTIDQGWFVDSGIPANSVFVDNVLNQVKLTGFNPYVGKSMTICIAGLDMGEFVVAADGSVTVPMTGLLTAAYLASYKGKTTTAWDTAAVTKYTVTNPGFSIQSFVDTSIVTGAEDNTDFVYDPGGDRIIICSAGSASTSGIMVYKASTGAFLGGITAPALMATGKRVRNFNPAANSIFGPFVIDQYGYLCFPTSGSNQSPIVRVDISNPASIFIEDIFGLAAGGLLSDPQHMPQPQSMCAVSAGNQSYLVCCGNIAFTGVSLLQTNSRMSGGYPGFIANISGQSGGAFLPTESGCDCCVGPAVTNGKSSVGTAYILGHTNNAAASTAAITLYKMTLPEQNVHSKLPAPVFSTIGALLPSAIDAAWSHFTVVEGPVFDRTDGNVIIWCQTNDAVAHQKYVVKVSTSTGQVIWATFVADLPNGRPGLNFSNVQNSTLLWMTNNHLYTCTTSSGAVVQTTITGLTSNTTCCSDDTNGALYAFGQYTGGGGSPAPLNATTTGTFWYRLQGTGAISTSATLLYNMPKIPALAGYTYTSQGQILRPVAQAATGARNGPGWAKTRRTHKLGLQTANTQGIAVGATFATVVTADLKSDGVNTNPLNVLYTGVLRTEIDCPYDFDSMLCWQITRPYPASVTAVGGFLSTQDI